MKIRMGEALGKGARILKENPIIFLPAGIWAIFGSAFAYFTINFYQPGEEPTPIQAFTGILSEGQYWLGFILLMIGSTFLFCMVVRMVYDATRGEVSLSSGAKVAIRKFIPVLIAIIFWKLISVIGTLFLVLPGTFLFIKLIFWIYVLLIDGKGIFSSAVKSWQIVRGNWWKAFGLFVFWIVTMGVPSQLFTFLPRLAESFTIFLMTLLWLWVVSTFVIAYLQLRGEETRGLDLPS